MQLVELGLRPDELCVEYGCGSLWCAEPVIRRQQPGRFIGLDVTDRFYELGRQRLGSLLTEKQVGLAVISRRTLADVAALRPALVYSHRVLHHVPRRALPRYVRSHAALLNEQTILVIENAPLIMETAVNGRPAFWVMGPHTFMLTNGRAQEWQFIEGNVLIWWTGKNLTFRLEGAESLTEAIRMAESLHEVEE